MLDKSFNLPFILIVGAVICVLTAGISFFFASRAEDEELRNAVAKIEATRCAASSLNHAVVDANLDIDRQVYQYVSGQAQDAGIKRALLAGARAKKELADAIIEPPDCKKQLAILEAEGIELPPNLKIVQDAQNDPFNSLEDLITPEVDPTDPTINPENPNRAPEPAQPRATPRPTPRRAVQPPVAGPPAPTPEPPATTPRPPVTPPPATTPTAPVPEEPPTPTVELPPAIPLPEPIRDDIRLVGTFIEFCIINSEVDS